MKKGKIHGGRSLLYKRCECSCVCPPQERKWQANDEWMRGAACGLNYRGIGGLVLPLFPFNVLGHTLCNAVQSNPNLGDNTVPGDARRPIITVQLEVCLCLSTFCQESQIQRREEKWEPCRNNGIHTSKPNKWRVEAWVWVMDQTPIAPTTIMSLSGFENKVGICPDFFFSYCTSLCYVNTCACSLSRFRETEVDGIIALGHTWEELCSIYCQGLVWLCHAFLAAAVTPTDVIDRKRTLEAINAVFLVTTKHNKPPNKDENKQDSTWQLLRLPALELDRSSPAQDPTRRGPRNSDHTLLAQ